jgi:hypothetical protein
MDRMPDIASIPPGPGTVVVILSFRVVQVVEPTWRRRILQPYSHNVRNSINFQTRRLFFITALYSRDGAAVRIEQYSCVFLSYWLRAHQSWNTRSSFSWSMAADPLQLVPGLGLRTRSLVKG